MLAISWRDGNRAIAGDAFRESKWDVVSEGQIWVDQRQALTWGASLWYARLPACQNYRWYEVSYVRTDTPIGQMPVQCVHHREADLAIAGTVINSYGLAFGPQPIDDESEEPFQQRWIDLFALAAAGQLRHPAQFPVKWPVALV